MQLCKGCIFLFIRTRFLRQVLPRDYNLGFGGFSAAQDATSTVNSPIDSPVSSGTTDSRPLISWIFNNEGSLAAYHEAYDRFIREWIESG